ncbi:MAG: hypothetical protein GSR83_03495 [Desulfurococcales archaeon]|nr:hypothetical protein [Desulfurococcales archaeon]
MNNPEFKALCNVFHNLLNKTADIHIPSRLLEVIYYNLNLLNLKKFEEYLEEKRIDHEHESILDAYVYSFQKLLSERDISGFPLFVRFLKEDRASFLKDKLSTIPRTAGLLFPASQNIEPYKSYLTSMEFPPHELAKVIVETALNIEKNIVNSSKSTPDDRVYTALHLSRSMAEISRTVYSMNINMEDLHVKLKCKNYIPTYRCILLKAIKLADTVIETAIVPRAPVLGYIQIMSTVTRTDLWKDNEFLSKIKAKLDDAWNVLMNSNYSQLNKLDALSLEGSFYYNTGWFYATNKKFDLAGERFRKAFRSFFILERNNEKVPLGFLRGVYVSLWNYYLMWFNHDLEAGGFIKEDKLQDAECWGNMTRIIVNDPSLQSLIWKLGIHAFYAYALSLTASQLLGKEVKSDPVVLSIAPERIKVTTQIIVNLLNNKVNSALDMSKKAGLKPVIMELLNCIQGKRKCPQLNADPWEIIEKYRLTIRELPLLEYIINKLDDREETLKGIALLVLYTL